MKAPNARPASACDEFCGALRSDQSFSGTNTRPEFWPWPEKLKPSTATTWSTSGCFMKKPSTCCITAVVRSIVAPGGNCTLTIR